MHQISAAGLERYTHRVVAAVLERLCVPFLMLDATGTIVFSNALAETILDDGNHLKRDAHERVTVFSEDAMAQVARFLTGLERLPDEIDLMLEARDGAPPRFVSLSAFRAPRLEDGPDLPAMAVMFIREGDDEEGVVVAKARFGLSGAETEVLRAIMAGISVGEHARRRGVSVHTARKQLNTVLQKVGVSRQNQLSLVVDALSGRGRDLATAAAMADEAQRSAGG